MLNKDNNTEYKLSTEEYGKVLDNIVVACVDVAIIYNNQILLEKRLREPAKNLLWIFGGRMIAGEDYSQTAKRVIQNEIKLRINEDRFFKIGDFNLKWPTRHEEPAENGCHHLLIAHGVNIKHEEFCSINFLIENENINWAWYKPSEIKTKLNSDSKLIEIINSIDFRGNN